MTLIFIFTSYSQGIYKIFTLRLHKIIILWVLRNYGVIASITFKEPLPTPYPQSSIQKSSGSKYYGRNY